MSKNKQQTDSEFYREAIADAKAIRENAIETAKEQLGEAFTPRLKSMLSQTIQQEMEDMENHDDEEEMELGLDLEEEDEDYMDHDEDYMDETDHHDEDDYMEELEDDEELDLEEVMSFIEAVSTDDRHSSGDSADAHSVKGPDHAGPDMLDTDTEDVPDGHGHDDEDAVMEDVMQIMRQLEQEADEEMHDDEEMMEAFLAALSEEEHEEDYMDYEDYEEEMDEVFEIDLNEFGASGVSREPMDAMAGLSEPYMQDADGYDLSDVLDISGEEYDPHELQTGTSGYEDIDDEPLSESINFNALLRELEEEEEEEHEEEMYEAKSEVKRLRQENAGLKNELKKHRQVVGILRDKINETNLINSKLLYTNRLFKKFGLGESKKLRVIEAFDRTKNVREAKLVYTTLAENFKKNSGSERMNESQKSKKTQLAEAIKNGLNSKKSSGSTKPTNSKKILNESTDLRSRMKKLANINQ